jgi:hypothetical protein
MTYGVSDRAQTAEGGDLSALRTCICVLRHVRGNEIALCVITATILQPHLSSRVRLAHWKTGAEVFRIARGLLWVVLKPGA